VYGKISSRNYDGYTVSGNKITGGEGEPVYKIREYDKESGEFTGQNVAKPQGSLSKASIENKATIIVNAFVPDKQIVVNSEDGSVNIQAVLATTEPRKSDGSFFPLNELRAMANQINTRGLAMPAVDSHKDFKEAMVQNGFNFKAVRKSMKKKRGILNSIKAYVEGGKLWVDMVLDEAYSRVKDEFKNLSVEAQGDYVPGGPMRDVDVSSFIFTKSPELSGAKIME